MSTHIARHELEESVRELSDIGEKLSGTHEEKLACDYITRKLREYGVQFKVYECDGYIGYGVRSQVSGSLEGRHFICSGASAAFTKSTPEDGITAQIAIVHDHEKNSFSDIQVKGRIVVVNGLPNYAIGMRAAEKGALAVLFASSGEQFHKMQTSPLWGPPVTDHDLGLLLPIPLMSISAPNGNLLRQMGNDSSITVVSQTKAEWKKMQFPVAEIPGANPKFLLAGAHYCTWDKGSTDNVAGAALLLELARILQEQQPELHYGIRLAWWPGHEQGVYAGSAWYADTHWIDLHSSAIAYMNIDIVGTKGASLKVIRNQTAEISHFTERVVQRIAGTMTPKNREFASKALRREDKYLPANRLARNSDQSFAGIGLTSLQVSSFLPAESPDHLPHHGIAWWWQTAHDDVDRVCMDELTTDTQLHVDLATGILKAGTLPWRLAPIADDFHTSLREYREAAPACVPLRSLEDEISKFKNTAESFDAWIEKNHETHRNEAVNQLLLSISKQLNPVLYHAVTSYDYDRTRRNRALPGLAAALDIERLDADQKKMARIAVQRACNRITHALVQARAEINQYLSLADNGNLKTGM